METRRETSIDATVPEESKILEVYQAPFAYQPTHCRRENEVMDSEMKSPKAPSVTAQNMSYLEDCIDNLFKSAEVLGIRLENILSEGSPEVAAERRSYGGNSPLSEQLAVFCRRLNDLQDRLEYLTARIDL
jgi:hypothetical protein